MCLISITSIFWFGKLFLLISVAISYLYNLFKQTEYKMSRIPIPTLWNIGQSISTRVSNLSFLSSSFDIIWHIYCPCGERVTIGEKKCDLHICTILASYIILIMGYKWNIIVVNIQYIIYVLKKLNGPGTLCGGETVNQTRWVVS